MSRRGGIDRAGTPGVEWAGVILTNSEGHLLLNLRGPEKLFAPNCWDLVGGTMETGESPDTCLIREVFEETGQRLSEAEWLRDYDLSLPDGDFGRLHVFTAVLSKPASDLHVGEGIEHRFFPPEALPSLDLAPGISVVLEDFISSERYRHSGGAQLSR